MELFHLNFDFSVSKMSCMWYWLPSNSLTSVIYQDLSSFQVYMELFHLKFDLSVCKMLYMLCYFLLNVKLILFAKIAISPFRVYMEVFSFH